MDDWGDRVGDGKKRKCGRKKRRRRRKTNVKEGGGEKETGEQRRRRRNWRGLTGPPNVVQEVLADPKIKRYTQNLDAGDAKGHSPVMNLVV